MKPSVINPFIYLAGAKALIIGVSGILLSGVVAYFTNTHFDGVLDIHYGAGKPFWVFLSVGLVNWIVVAFTLGIAAVILSGTRFRIIDLLGTLAVARIPFILTTLIPLFYEPNRLLDLLEGTIPLSTSDIFGITISGLIALIVIIWVITWTYQAYTHTANLKGSKAVSSFIIALIVATVIDKIILASFFGYVFWPAQQMP